MARRKHPRTPGPEVRRVPNPDTLYWQILNDYPFDACVALAQSLAAYVDYYACFPDEPKGGKHGSMGDDHAAG